MKKLIPILALFIMLLTGCASGDKEIKTTVDEFLNLYRLADSSAANYLFNHKEDSEIQFEGLQKLLAQRLEYKIGKAEKDKENKELTYVNVTVKNISFEEVYESVLPKFEPAMSEEAILNILEEAFGSENAPMKEFKIRVPIRKVEDQYKIVLNGQVSNALMGGLNEYLAALTGGVQGE